jgi:hypothetical protein
MCIRSLVSSMSILSLYIYGYRIMSVVNPKIVWEEAGDRFWQLLTFPEEDRHLHTSAPWDGGYRWFRSPNVICLEKYRGPRTRSA